MKWLPDLEPLISRLGCGTKLRRELMRTMKWRDADWYANWPQLAPLLEAACRAVRYGVRSPP